MSRWVFLALSLFLSLVANAQGSIPLKVTITTTTDTLYDVYSRNIYDSIVAIRIHNNGTKTLEIPDRFIPGYEKELFTTFYFNTWYLSNGKEITYNKFNADIDVVEDPIQGIAGLILKPGAEKVIYFNPFQVNGRWDEPGMHRLQVVYVLPITGDVQLFYSNKLDFYITDTKR